MNDQEFFERNLELSTEFSRYLMDHPEIEEKIPTGAHVVFTFDSDPEWTQRNLELARKNRESGRPVVVVRMKALAPRQSRLIEPRLDLAANF